MAPNSLRFDNPGPEAALPIAHGGRGARSTAGHPAPRYDECDWSARVIEVESSGFEQALASLDEAAADQSLRSSHVYKARVMHDRDELLEWYKSSSGSGTRLLHPPTLTAGAPPNQAQKSPEVRAVREKLDASLHALHAQAVMFYHAKVPNSGPEQAAAVRERHASRQRFSRADVDEQLAAGVRALNAARMRISRAATAAELSDTRRRHRANLATLRMQDFLAVRSGASQRLRRRRAGEVAPLLQDDGCRAHPTNEVGW
jgi:hypothetical protein